MISGISAARSGLAAAQARFERAAGSIATEYEAGTDARVAPVPSVLDMAGAQLGMISSKLAWSASLVALKTSNDMLTEAIRIGGYGVE